MGRGMVFGKVVGEIVFTSTPMNYELALLDSVTHPVKSHVYGFGATLFDCFSGACIFGLDGCCSLWMSHFFECNAERDTVAFWNMVPSSASVADAITFRMMELIV
jgi:hypothetical protein